MADSEAVRTTVSRCPVCSGTQRIPWLEALGFQLVRCGTCGHRYSTTMLRSTDLAGGYYDEPTGDLQARSSRAKRRRFEEYVALLPPPSTARRRVLDVGCNAGELLSLFAERGWEVAGVEPSPGPARYAREHLPGPVWEGYAEDAVPQGESFDLVTLTHVLEHVAEPKRLLHRLRSALRPGGAMLVEEPNADDRLLRAYGGYFRPLCPGDHVSFFDARSLQRLLTESGFDVASVVSPVHARDIIYPAALSTLDWARARLRSRRGGGPQSEGVQSQTRYRGRLRAPLRSVMDRMVEAVDPAFVRLGAGGNNEHRTGPVLIVLATLR